jgi:hypothetical protein
LESLSQFLACWPPFEPHWLERPVEPASKTRGWKVGPACLIIDQCHKWQPWTLLFTECTKSNGMVMGPKCLIWLERGIWALGVSFCGREM